jgi:RNA polymerase sigma factor (TIGR02999 family)
MTTPPDITRLLVAWSNGDEEALDALTPLVHRELRRIAARQMAAERPDHLLHATALVNEAYLRLVDTKAIRWQDRGHFFAMAAQIMRRILVDMARARGRVKRGRGHVQVSLSEAGDLSVPQTPDVMALDDALKSLEAVDQRKSRVVEMRFFGGLSLQETADVLQVSVATVRRDWRRARGYAAS